MESRSLMAGNSGLPHHSVQALTHLVGVVRQARVVVDDCRSAPHTQQDLVQARGDLLAAMQEYAGALRDNNLPVPPRLRDELRLYLDLNRSRPVDGRRGL
jgi:hypothetical protein